MFNPGDKVLYVPLDFEGNVYKTQAGVVKYMDPNSNEHAFVWYHSGCTAARTKIEDLRRGFNRDTERVHTGCHYCFGSN